MKAQKGLAKVYGSDFNTTNHNDIRSYMWYKIASLSGDPDAIKLLNVLAQRMTPEERQAAEKMVIACQKNMTKGCD